jgi:CelD/BcsL family acetyltransferase involved in cellulose biosynthesis
LAVGRPERTTEEATGARPAGGAAIVAEVADAARFATLLPEWLELGRRAAEPNAFMDPAVAAAAAAGGARIPVILAWDGPRLAGAWVMRIGRARSGLPFRVLLSPPHPLCFGATPVVDRALAEPALAAMLDAVAREPGLPHLLDIDDFNDGPVLAAFRRVMAARRAAPAILGGRVRPRLQSALSAEAYAAQAMSHTKLKQLRQYRRRLAKAGPVALRVHRGAEVAAAFETFLELEASGWKGRAGTAMLKVPEEAAFARAAVAGLAAAGNAEIWSLEAGGRAVSMAVILASGAVRFDWKVAYDEAVQNCSPGVLLAQDYTAGFLDDPAVEAADSCAFDESGFLGGVWTERQGVARLLADARRGGSLQHRLLAAAERGYRDCRELAKRLYHALGAARRRKAAKSAADKGAADQGAADKDAQAGPPAAGS